MIKDSAEGLSDMLSILVFSSDWYVERIMQNGKKKLVLDHVIVQRMEEDEEDGNDIQSILTYGAKALFEETDQARDITCKTIEH